MITGDDIIILAEALNQREAFLFLKEKNTKLNLMKQNTKKFYESILII